MTDKELWIPIPGYPKYEASSLGRIRSWRSRRKNYIPPVPKILKPSFDTDGYMQLSVSKNERGGQQLVRKVHALVLLAFVGERPDGYECAHGNGKKDDNRIENLRYCTSKENKADKITHGTSARGENNPSSRLSNSQVLKIRKDKRPSKVIAKEYGIKFCQVCAIRRRASWSHL